VISVCIPDSRGELDGVIMTAKPLVKNDDLGVETEVKQSVEYLLNMPDVLGTFADDRMNKGRVFIHRPTCQA
jgi:hypothetical protein